MTPEYVVKLGQQTLTLVIYVSGPMLIVALIVGLGISIFQAVTHILEMTLTFIPKIQAVVAVVMFILPWSIRQMVDFTTQLIRSIPTVIG